MTQRNLTMFSNTLNIFLHVPIASGPHVIGFFIMMYNGTVVPCTSSCEAGAIVQR